MQCTLTSYDVLFYKLPVSTESTGVGKHILVFNTMCYLQLDVIGILAQVVIVT